MKLRVITATKTSEYTVSLIDIHTPSGNRIILEDHVPMVATLTEGRKLTFTLKTGEIESIHIAKQGIIEITRQLITVLL